MVVSCNEMKAVEASAFESGVSAESLMNEAGLQISALYSSFSPCPDNAWSGSEKGITEVMRSWPQGIPGNRVGIKLQPLLRKMNGRNSLRKNTGNILPKKQDTPSIQAGWSVFSGRPPLHRARRPARRWCRRGLREPIRSGAREINRLRATVNAQVFAIDLPTGLNGDTGGRMPIALWRISHSQSAVPKKGTRC